MRPARDVLRLARGALADERMRFLLVGGFNTALAYALFLGVELLSGGRYLLSLGVSYLIATLVAFVLHRRLTFGVVGRDRIVADFLRFESVYVVMLAVNAGMLALLVTVAGWPSWSAQALSIVVTTILSYVGHRFFSFRRPPVSSRE